MNKFTLTTSLCSFYFLRSRASVYYSDSSFLTLEFVPLVLKFAIFFLSVSELTCTPVLNTLSKFISCFKSHHESSRNISFKSIIHI